MIHLGKGKIEADSKQSCSEHNGAYAVVTLKLAGFELTIFPETRAAELADALAKAAAELAEVVESLRVVALSD